MRKLPRNPHPFSLRMILASGFPVTPGPLCNALAVGGPVFGFQFQWNPLTRKSSFPPSLGLILPAWKLPPQYPLVDSFCIPHNPHHHHQVWLCFQRVPPNNKLPVTKLEWQIPARWYSHSSGHPFERTPPKTLAAAPLA